MSTDNDQIRSWEAEARGPSRRRFLSQAAGLGMGLAAVPLTGTLAGCGNSANGGTSSSSGPATTSLQISYLPSVEYAGYYVAASKGYYAAEKITNGFVSGGPSVPDEANVAAQKAMIGIDGADIICSARANGAPLVIFGAQFQKSPLGIVSLASDPISTPTDLIGKTVNVLPSLVAAMHQFLATNGVKYSDVHFVPGGGDAGPLLNKSVAAEVTFVTETVPLVEAHGVKTTTMLFSDFGYVVYNDCPFTTKTVLQEHPDVLERWLRASIRGWQWANKNVAASSSITLSKYAQGQGLSYESQVDQMEAQIPLMVSPTTQAHGLFYMDQAGINENLKTIRALGIKADAAAFDTSILDKVYTSGKPIIDGP